MISLALAVVLTAAPDSCFIVLSDPGPNPDAVVKIIAAHLEAPPENVSVSKGEPVQLEDKSDCAKGGPVVDKLRKAGARAALVGKGKKDVELTELGSAAIRIVSILRVYTGLDVETVKAKTRPLPQKLGLQLDDASAGVLVTDLTRFGAKARVVAR